MRSTVLITGQGLLTMKWESFIRKYWNLGRKWRKSGM